MRVARLVAGIEPEADKLRIDVAVDFGLGDDAVHDRRLADDVGDPHARIERGHRVLEDHLDLEQGGAAAVGDELVQGAMHLKKNSKYPLFDPCFPVSQSNYKSVTRYKTR